MRRLTLWLAPLFFLLTACSDAPDDRAWQTAIPPAGEARVVLYYPPKSMGTDGLIDVAANQKHDCKLAPETYFVLNLPAGKTALALAFCGMPGITRVGMETTAGKTYYLRITPYDSSITGMVSGYPAEDVPDGAPPHNGPFHVTRVGEPEARKELADYRQAKR